MAGAALELSQWQQHGGTVLQSTASNGRIRRTFVSPSGEKFRTWKECLKYMGAMSTTKSTDTEEPDNKKKRPSPPQQETTPKSASENGHAEQDSANENNAGENTSEKKRKTHKQRKAPKTATSSGSGKRSREPCSDDEEDSASRNPKVLIVEEGEEEEELETEPSRRMPKRAAACTSFKEKRVALNEKDSVIEVKQDKVVEGEEVAIVLSAEPGEAQSPQRRILDFIVHDEEGKSQPIELLDVIPLYLTAVVLPTNGILDRERGFRCEGFGPLHSWSITGYEEGRPIVWLCTDMAEYICVKPSGAYKKHYDMLFEKAIVCVEVYRALSKPDGGDPNLGLDDLIARVSRNLLSTKQSFGGQCLGRDYIVSQGTFIVNQLTALDEEASKGEQLFSGLPALVALDNENKKRDVALRSAAQQAPMAKSVGIRIGENVSAEGASSACSKEEDAVDEDEKLARLLQEQEDRKAYSRQNRRPQAGKGKFYIKINEDEIANDYPLPAFYKAQEEEMDEYVLFDDDTSVLAPEDLPRRMLHDWSLYNSDSRLMPLELLPMLAGTETDVEIFGSGIMTEDDGSGYCLSEISNCKSSDTAPAGPNSDGKSVCSGSDGSVKEGGPQGIRIYLSSIKEWMIEFGASMIFISIRTDGAWYRLGNPSPQYAKWYLPVLKTAKLAIRIITMLKQETRASKLSFSDVIKRLVDQQKDEDTFISSKIPEIERYVVVHGQIILQQFAEYPDESIKRSAFVTGLTFKMEQKHHVKLLTSKKKVLIKKGKNMNPRASFRPDGTKPKPMRATTTKLVHRIWSEYYSKFKPEVEEPEQTALGNGDIDVDEQDEALEESDEEEETVFVLGQKKGMPLTLKSNQSKSQYKEVKWMGKSSGTTDANEPLYMKAVVRSEEISVGGVVLLDLQELSDGADLPSMLLIEYLYEKDGSQWFHGRVLERGFLTVLGNAADAQEVFLTERCADADLADIKTTVVVQIRNRTWGHTHRMINTAEDDAYRAQAIEKEKKGLAMEYFCRALYCPEQGAYFKLPYSSLALGTGKCMACKMRDEAKEKEALHLLPDEDGFKFHGMEYHLKDFLYLMPDTFPPLKEEDQVVEKFKASRNRGLKSFAICQLLDIKRTSGLKKITPTSIQLVVRRFFRPDDIGPLKAYVADVREVYYSEETATVGLGAVMGKCEVQKQHQIQDISAHATFNNVFFCSCIFDPQKGTVKQLPANIKLSPSWHYEMEKGKSPATELANAKRKGKAVETEIMLEEPSSPNSTGYLATLDIFAGCGGLSEGLHQSGVSHTKWAIEYEQAAAEAFKLNHQDAEVFCENCNVILRCAMEKGGDLDDCLSTSEADALSEKLDNEAKSKLPVPGEVDFISGGPPCQGFSGMNRFNQRTWSKVQCEMILSFLSFADYFRPRFFLLENVRNFVSFNKGQTFRLTLASLLEMGYQVRFGVLQAGNYGVSQSRKRAFIWAASPEDLLPEWPEPRHVFASSQLKIVLPGGLQYAAVRDAAEGAPLRSITVQDAIGDLPPVGNGADKLEIAYGESPQSWFQKNIRGKENTLYDHISKEMNELNYIRCQRIPKRPGADWRDLPEEKVKLSTGQLVDLIPWCLPNTAERHNQWKGLFGRLDWDGNFPTSVTDPQPMGKVGMCFHPEQDRIVTVRECARSQGFPDGYKFSGNIQSKHRQIGNAVPPPLARALGEKLKEVIDAKKVVI